MYRIEEKGKYKVLRMEGELTALSSVERLRETLNHMIAIGHRHVAVDLTQSVIIDSSAIGCIVSYHRKFDDIGGEIIVVSSPNRVMEALLCSSVNKVVRIVASEREIR